MYLSFLLLGDFLSQLISTFEPNSAMRKFNFQKESPWAQNTHIFHPTKTCEVVAFPFPFAAMFTCRTFGIPRQWSQSTLAFLKNKPASHAYYRQNIFLLTIPNKQRKVVNHVNLSKTKPKDITNSPYRQKYCIFVFLVWLNLQMCKIFRQSVSRRQV